MKMLIDINTTLLVLFFFFFKFSVRLLSVLRVHSGFFIPATTANDLQLRRMFLSQIVSITFIFLS